MNTDRLEAVRTIISEILRLPATEIDPEEPLERYGVDSLVVNDIHTRLEAEVGSSTTRVGIRGGYLTSPGRHVLMNEHL